MFKYTPLDTHRPYAEADISLTLRGLELLIETNQGISQEAMRKFTEREDIQFLIVRGIYVEILYDALLRAEATPILLYYMKNVHLRQEAINAWQYETLKDLQEKVEALMLQA